jgi:hypothetical protein
LHVPYLKFSRDKRGYENFFLIDGREHAGKSRPRLLFWFRTPPQLKVGREPFSDEVRQMVEAQNPDVTFDWGRIISTPIPSPDADHWRERRRAEKAAKRAAKEEDAVEAVVALEEAEAQPVAAAVEPTSAVEDVAAVVNAIEALLPAELAGPASELQAPSTRTFERRRRRRRRRHGRGGHAGTPPTSAPSEETAPAQRDAATASEEPPPDEV